MVDTVAGGRETNLLLLNEKFSLVQRINCELVCPRDSLDIDITKYGKRNSEMLRIELV